MAGSPYEAYKAGMLQASCIEANRNLQEAFVRFVSLWGADGRDVSEHPLWPLFNSVEAEMHEIVQLAQTLAEEGMTGTIGKSLDNVAQL